jgi:hypothetical protein
MFSIQFIGSEETDQKAVEVPNLGISSLWTPENHYYWSKSRYGNHVSAVVEQVQRPKLLVNSMLLLKHVEPTFGSCDLVLNAGSLLSLFFPFLY